MPNHGLDTVRSTIEPLLARLDLELFDVVLVGSGRARTLRVTLDREGGVDLAAIGAATDAISPVLDEMDPIPGGYTLEVSSPGVERPLRRPDEFRRFLGTTISVKTTEPVDGVRRHRGSLTTATDEGVEVAVEGEVRSLRYDQIAEARTVFEWGPAPRPPGAGSGRAKRSQIAKRLGTKEGTRQ